MFLWAHEYEKAIKEKFLGNKYMRLWLTHGLVDDGYELRLYSGRFTYDMMFVYKVNYTAQWSGYHVHLKKYM